jgi:hypothetical protein
LASTGLLYHRLNGRTVFPLVSGCFGGHGSVEIVAQYPTLNRHARLLFVLVAAGPDLTG